MAELTESPDTPDAAAPGASGVHLPHRVVQDWLDTLGGSGDANIDTSIRWLLNQFTRDRQRPHRIANRPANRVTGWIMRHPARANVAEIVDSQGAPVTVAMVADLDGCAWQVPGDTIDDRIRRTIANTNDPELAELLADVLDELGDR